MSTRSEIETRVLNWADAQTPRIPVAIEGVKFTKPVNGPYIEVTLLGANSVSRGVDAEGTTTYGMFQLNCYAVANRGMGEVEALCRSMVALFPVLPKTGNVSIDSPLSWGGSDVIDGFVFVPVRGSYRTET